MKPEPRPDVDPFQLELLKSCFDTIADDMALTLMRTAHSGIVRDSLDFSTALLDADGLTLAQGICTPMHDEHTLYDNLRYDRLGVALRLEQERIGFGRVKEALAKLDP